jgi:hypothetical protein
VSGRRAHALQLVALALVLVALALCVWFRATGGRWERVESPSMGTTAPVGTLLWTRPVATGELRVGDIVSFRQPDRVDGPVYSHRVREVEPDGSFRTRGDLSGDDQWLVTPDLVVGKVVWVVPAAGRLVQAAPVLVIGGLVTAGVVALVRRGRRLPLAMLGASFTLAAAIVVYQPLVGAQLLSTEPSDGGGMRSTYVSTGLFPVSVSTPGGDHVVLSAGEAGTVDATRPVEGRLTVDLGPAVPPWFWLALVALSFAPAVGGSVRSAVRHPHVRGRHVVVPA